MSIMTRSTCCRARLRRSTGALTGLGLGFLLENGDEGQML